MEFKKSRSVWNIVRRVTSFFQRSTPAQNEAGRKTEIIPLTDQQAQPRSDEIVKSALSDTAVIRPTAKTQSLNTCSDPSVGRPRRSKESFNALKAMIQKPLQSDVTRKMPRTERQSENVPKHLWPLLKDPPKGKGVTVDVAWGIPLSKRNFENIDTSTTIGYPPIGENHVVGFLKYDDVDEDLESLKRWFYRFRYC